jgi:acetyltransferase-like isoleucine patch superfamily enzyme
MIARLNAPLLARLQRLSRLPYRVLDRSIYRLLLEWHGVACADGVSLLGAPIITRHAGSTIRIGRNVVLCSRSADTALGVAHPVIIRTLSPDARIEVGDDAGLSGTTICAATSVSIGAECLIGADVSIVDTDFHPLAPTGRRYSREGIAHFPVAIGRNVFIGTGSRILKGAQIGDDTVIGAGSVVTGTIPAGVIAAGNPCRVLRKL